MNRSFTALFAALEATLVIGVGIGIPLLPLSVLWAVQYGFALDWIIFWRASVDSWLLGHGVDIHVTMDPALATSLGLAPADSSFWVTIAPLGFAVLTALLAVRAGRRVGETKYRNLGSLVSLATFAGLSAFVTFTALYPLARPSMTQGIVLPTLVFGLGFGIGLLRTRRAAGDDSGSSIRDWVNDWSPLVRTSVFTALRAGAAGVTALILVSAVLVSVLFAINYATVISLYEGLHAGIVGGIALTIAQLAFMPNFVIWTASWLVGPGFAIGEGSSVSPLSTQLGPVPAVPALGALPTGDFAFGFIGLLAPLVIGFLVGAVLRPRLVEALDAADRLWAWLLGVGLGAGVVGGILMGFLAWISGGSAGPGRLSSVGPDPVLVGVFAALELGVSCALGLLLSRSRRSNWG